MARFLLLIDGSSLLSTQFYGNLPREILFAKTTEEKEKYFHKILMTKKGIYTNALLGFFRTLFKIAQEQKPEYVAIAWDLTRDTFRREIYPEYKANRDETLYPLKEQFENCQKMLREMGICQLMDLRYEADDFCGSAARLFENEIPVRILTKDHDYLQLVTDKTHMWLMHPSAEKTEEMYKKYGMEHPAEVPERAFELTPELVEAEFGVKPCHINSLKGLQGDPSDNIKGVKGVGPDTAVKLIQKYGTVDALYEEIKNYGKAGEESLKKLWKEELGISRSPLNFLTKESDEELAGEKAALLSEELATIKCDIDLGNLKLEDLRFAPERNAVQAMLDEYELASLNTGFLDADTEEDDSHEEFLEVSDYSELQLLAALLSNESAIGIGYSERGLSLATADGRGYLIPESVFINKDTFRGVIAELLKRKTALYTMTGKELVKLTGRIFPDVTIMAYLLDPLKGDYPAEMIASRYLSKNRRPNEEVRPQFEAFVAVSAYPVLMAALQKAGMAKLFTEIELPVMGTLARMEVEGIRIERSELQAYSIELKKHIDELEKEIYQLSGTTFNINSPKQLGEVLFEQLGLKGGKKTKSGYSTAADILEKLAPEAPVVGKILEYRTYSKLRSTYAEGLQEYIREDGRIHCTFNQTITATGRLSCTEPNLQNIPAREELGRLIRKCFKPKDGCVFVDADYSQIELRILAHLSDDENLINAYQNARDIHTMTAAQVFHVKPEEVTKTMRRDAKAVNFGIVYGISSFGLSENLSISRKDAQEYINRYFEIYPGVKRYLDGRVESAKETGVSTTLFGRIRPIPELESSNFNQRSFGERVAMNSPIQGTAADIMKIAMIRVEKALNEAGLRSKIVLQIHDELVIEALEEEADQVQALLVREMEGAANLLVKLEAEAGRGYSLYDAK